MTSAQARVLTLLGTASIAGCAPVTPEEIAASEQALTVCHTTVVEGVDVYEGQGNIDWNQVHASGREFAIARIADGNHIDSTFATNYAGIRAAGMVRGSYYFFRPQIAAATQAQTILNAVGSLQTGDLPVTIDVECMCPFHSGGACGSSSYSDCVSPATEHAVLDDVISMVAAGTGRMPMIYTGAWFWDGNQYLAGQAQYPSAPLWVSGYTTGCVTVPSGWTDWQIWQYNDTGSAIPGISGTSIDRNRWNGDLASLMAFTGGGSPIYGAHYVSQSFPLASAPPLQIPQGGSVAASITLRNTGTADWDANTRLGTTGTMMSDRDRASIFVAPDWISANRLSGLPAGMIVHPGEQYQFTWTFHVPDGTPLGVYDEHYGMVEEGTAWFGDPGQGGPSDSTIEAMIEVTQGPDAGMPPQVDAGTDAGGTMMTSDASHPTDDGGSITMMGDGGVVMGRPISGGCGCATGGSSSNGGALLAFLVGLMLFVRRRVRA